MFVNQQNPSPVKTAWIGQQSRNWRHSGLIHSVPHPKKPSSLGKRHESINYRQENAGASDLASKKTEWNRMWHHFGLHLCNWDLKKPFSAKFDCFSVWWLCAPPYCFHAHMQSKDPPLSLHNEWPILKGRGIGCCLAEFYGLYSGKNNRYYNWLPVH